MKLAATKEGGPGVLLHFLVTGSFPVEGHGWDQIREAHREGRVRLLRDCRPDLPDSFVRVVEKATAPDPKQRYATAGEMERELASVVL